MSSKAYSKQEREEIKIKLLEVGLQLYSHQGIKQTRLEDILSVVGISKPFFYKFYPSVENFIICAITYQWKYIDTILDKLKKQTELTWQQKLYKLFHQFVDYKNNGILVMTQEEEVWVRKKLDNKTYDEFMNFQVTFFEKLLHLCDIKKEKCDPEVLANLILSAIIIHSSAKKALPFFYVEKLDETAEAQIQAIIAYLSSLK